MTEAEKAGSARVPVDPRAADPEAAAREEAERYGLPFEVALENVRASIAKRAAALARIRQIRGKERARVTAWEAVAEAGQDGSGAESEAGAWDTPPASVG